MAQFFKRINLGMRADHVLKQLHDAEQKKLRPEEINFFESRIGLSRTLLDQLNERLSPISKRLMIANRFNNKDWDALEEVLSSTNYDQILKSSKQFTTIVESLRQFYNQHQGPSHSLKRDFGNNFSKLTEINKSFIEATKLKPAEIKLETKHRQLGLDKEFLQKRISRRLNAIDKLKKLMRKPQNSSLNLKGLIKQLEVEYNRLKKPSDGETSAVDSQMQETEKRKLVSAMYFLEDRIAKGDLQATSSFEQVVSFCEKDAARLHEKIKVNQKDLESNSISMEILFSERFKTIESTKQSLKDPANINAMDRAAADYLHSSKHSISPR